MIGDTWLKVGRQLVRKGMDSIDLGPDEAAESWLSAFNTRDFGENPGETLRVGAIETWYAANTGHDPALSYEVVTGTFTVDDAWLAANNGNGRVSFSGGRWFVERYRSTGTLRINTNPATPVTFTNMHVDSAGALYGFQSQTNASGIVLEHSTLAGNWNGGSGALNFSDARSPDQVTLRYVNLSGFRSGLYIFGGVTAEYCWSHDLYYTEGSHNTGGSIRAGNSVIRRCFITDGNSSAISLYPEYTPYSGVLVEENAVKLQVSDTGMEILVSAKNYITIQPGETRRVINNLFWRGGNRSEGGGFGGALQGITQAYGNHDRLNAPVGPIINPPDPGLPDLNSWPTVATTGVPDGVSLATYAGPMTITQDNTIINSQLITGALMIEAANVQIINCRINGWVELLDPATTTRSFTITDSEVHVGQDDHNWNTGIGRGNFTATRVEVTGGRRSINAEWNALVEDSMVHMQGADPGGTFHYSGMRMTEGVTLRHNSIKCEAGRGPGTGCSAALTGYGDFAPVRNNLIDNNLFLSGGGGCSVGAYGGASGDDGSKPYGHLSEHMRFTDNVWAKNEAGTFGTFGPIIDFDPTKTGNVWTGNIFDDGEAIPSKK